MKVKSVEKVAGDCDVSMRKKKLIYIFDLNLKVAWESLDGKQEGEIKMPECTYDESPKDYPLEITGDSEELKNAVKAELMPQIYKLFEKFPEDLLSVHGPTLLVQEDRVVEHRDVSGLKEASEAPKAGMATVDFGVPKPKQTVLTCKINYSAEFKCSKEDLFLAMFEKDRVQFWTRDQADIVAEPGKEFRIMNGNVSGSFVEVNRPDSVKMKWRLKQWPENHYSEVTVKLTQERDFTKLDLAQTGVPKSCELEMSDNWDQLFFNRIKHSFGYVM